MRAQDLLDPSQPTPKRQITVLAKAPHIGKVKTRLTQLDQQGLAQSTSQQKPLSIWETQRFHMWSLAEVVEQLCPRATALPPFLCVTQDHDYWSTLHVQGELMRQVQGHLGMKMYQALVESFDRFDEVSPHSVISKQDALLLLGTDSPHLDPAWLRTGLDYLNQQAEPSLVIGPAEDGGYYTIGCNRAALNICKPLFLNEIKWGSDSVFQESVEHAQKLALQLKLLPLSYDIDRPQDLLRAQECSQLNWKAYHDMTRAHFLSAPDQPKARQEYSEALSSLFALTRFGERMDLSAPLAINQALADPLSAYKNILIGGTNGKGSTSSALMQIGTKAGLKIGLFTSPHLVSFRERIRIGDELISHAEVAEGVKTIFAVAKQAQITLSFFEATWALAAWFFRKRGVTDVIWEVGLGGRLDATNSCEPILSVITSISLDHTHILGNSLKEIASEKSPIYRENAFAFTACKDDALSALLEVSWVKPISVEDDILALEEEYQAFECSRQTEQVDLHDKTMNATLIHSSHGRRNLALARRCALALKWVDTLSIQALAQLSWPGRLESLEGLWLDCAHNPESAKVLGVWLEKQSKPRHLIVGMSADKDVIEVLSILAQHCEKITFVSPVYPRCETAERLALRFEKELVPQLQAQQIKLPQWTVIPHLSEALSQRQLAACQVVTGSCFLVGEARALLLGVEFPELGLSTLAR